MEAYKKFIPCIYLKDGCAMTGFQKKEILSEDPVSLACFYSECNADELLIFDLSYDDASHDAALDIIKEICSKANLPVIGAGNVKRMEDIKKLLYAGCTKAALNYSKAGNIEITKEVSDKFGKEKIVACIADAEEIRANEEQLLQYVSEVILISEKMIKQAIEVAKLPFIVTLPEVSLDKILELLSFEHVAVFKGKKL